MKKSLFGYNARETEEKLQTLAMQNEALMSQNDRLEEELRNLQGDLDRKTAMLDEGMTKADADNYRSLKIAHNALQEKVAYLEKQLAEGENTTAPSAPTSSIPSVREFERLLQNACQDVLDTKNASVEQIHNCIADFVQRWSAAEAAMNDRIKTLILLNTESKQEYLRKTQALMDEYESVDRQLSNLLRTNEELNSASEDLKKNMEEVVDSVNSSDATLNKMR